MRRIAKIIIGSTAVVGFVGCANIGNLTSEDYSARHVVEDSSNSQRVKFDSKEFAAAGLHSKRDAVDVNMRLQGWIDKRNPDNQSHLLYLSISYPATGYWRIYNQAKFEDGSIAEVAQIWRYISSCERAECAYTEIIAIDVSSDRLVLGEDIRIALSSRSDHESGVRIPRNYTLAYANLIVRNSQLFARLPTP